MFALSVNGLNVVNSYVGRDFMTAIADRDMAGFVRLAILYVGVFAATTVVASSTGSPRSGWACYGVPG